MIRLAVRLFVVVLVFQSVAFGHVTVYPKGTTINDPLKAYQGYTIFSTHRAGDGGNLIMIDMNGKIVQTWRLDEYQLSANCHPLRHGNILASAKIAEKTYSLVELDWNSNVKWAFFDSVHCMLHHDFQRLESGNTLAIGRHLSTVPSISNKMIADDYIIEIDKKGSIVWKWLTSDHFDEFGFDAEARQLIYDRGGDWSHTNSIHSLPDNNLSDPRFTKGHILVSQRETNIVFVIDKSTGSIVWKLGPDNNLTIGQHQAVLLPTGSLGISTLLMFDNGGIAGYPMQARLNSRVIEVDPLTSTVVWRYTGKTSGSNYFMFFSPYMSGAQRLPNGNTLICESDTGRLFEVDPTATEIVWEYVNPYLVDGLNTVYRAWRVDLSWPTDTR
jgi:outer membrane protein assembly factor BamB